jgi:hypothetical protein
VQDNFGRNITAQGVTLIDWQGYMGNPAIQFTVIPPAGAKAPFQLSVSGTQPRLYFDLPSTGSATGPRKQLKSTGAPLTMAVSIFPAREKKKLDTTLTLQLSDANTHRWQITLPVHVIVTDTAAGATSAPATPTETFPILVDFSQDKTGFYKDEAKRKIFQQAIDDWAFYLAPVPLAQVPAKAERTFIFQPSGFTKSDLVTNAKPYTGLLLYTYGIDGPEIRSGGEPSQAGGMQQSNGVKLPLHRSGGVEVEIKGNYNKLGWNLTLRDDEWFKATNLKDIPNDLYSIVHHESGHALFFNANNPQWVRNGVLKNDAVRAYLGSDPRTDITDHFANIIDPASMRGAFGNEYHGKTPYGRWLITKLDLLCAQAVGYPLRPVDALIPLTLDTTDLPDAPVGKPYKTPLHARGGIPFYDWTLTDGKLPAGLSLNRFTGEITGMPTQAGKAAFTLQLREYTKDAPPLLKPLTLTVIAH